MRATSIQAIKNLSLRNELDNDQDRYLPPQAFTTHTAEGLSVEILWYPSAGRVGVATNGDAVWGDALTLEEVERFANETTRLAW